MGEKEKEKILIIPVNKFAAKNVIYLFYTNMIAWLLYLI